MDEESLPVDVSELGELVFAEQICPGVYYFVVQPNERVSAEEYYLLLDDAPLSKDAFRYGVPLQTGQGLVVSISRENAGGKVIDYEIKRYEIAHNILLAEGETLHECAIYGAELNPEYFGELPVPFLTPWGYTTRHRSLANGIYWLETDQGAETLAVSFPIWEADLSKTALRYARQCIFDKAQGIKKTLGYQFFPKNAICVAVFELLQTRSEWLNENKVNLPALMNAIWGNCPEYALRYNANEQRGVNDVMGILFQSLGLETELTGSAENMISMNPNAGADFWRW